MSCFLLDIARTTEASASSYMGLLVPGHYYSQSSQSKPPENILDTYTIQLNLHPAYIYRLYLDSYVRLPAITMQCCFSSK